MKYLLYPVSRKIFLGLIIVLFPVVAIAQAPQKEVYNHAQTWFSVNTVSRLSNRFGVIADAHIRRTDFISNPNFYFVRVAANFWLTENLTTAVGYGHMWVAPSTQGWHHFVQENRIYQQVQLATKLGKVSMLQRIRNEQRWQEKIVNDRFIDKYRFTDRIRYLLSFNIPLSKKPYIPALSVSDELAIQFGKEIVYNTFDQNRVFIGIKQSVAKHLSFDFGYMLVHQQRASGYQYDNNHTLRLFFYYTPDFRKHTSEVHS